MLHPEVAAGRQVVAVTASFVVGAPIGLGCYALLRPLRRWGRGGRFVAQTWAWWCALVAGFTTAVVIGGPYVIGSRRPVGGGGTGTVPLTRPAVLGISTALALGYAGFGLAAGREVPPRGTDTPRGRRRANA